MTDETETDKDVDVRIFAPVVLPFEPNRLRQMSHGCQGILCTCPGCAVNWITAMAMDLHEDDGVEKVDRTVSAMVTALAQFWEDHVAVPDHQDRDQELAKLLLKSVRLIRENATGQSQAVN